MPRCIPKFFKDSSVETISVLIKNPVGKLSDLFLVNLIYLNLSALTIFCYQKTILLLIQIPFLTGLLGREVF